MKVMLLSKLKAAAGALVLVAGIGLGAGVITWQYGPAAEGAVQAQADTDGKSAAAPEKREAKPHAYVIEPPDILLVKYAPRGVDDPVKIDGERLLRPDGTIRLGQLGSVLVTGLTPEQARGAIAKHLASRLDDFDPKQLTVKVVACNSKFFYVIAEGAGGEQVYRFPATGSETVLDAVAQINGPKAEGLEKRIWIARRVPAGNPEQILPVDWKAILRDGNVATNYQLLPGDRLYIKGRAPKRAEGTHRRDAVQEGGPCPGAGIRGGPEGPARGALPGGAAARRRRPGGVDEAAARAAEQAGRFRPAVTGAEGRALTP